MKKRIISLLLVVVLALGLFAACGKKDITPEKAQEIALKELGKTEAEVGHTHVDVADYEGIACFMVHVEADGQEYYVYIDQTGKVIHKQ